MTYNNKDLAEIIKDRLRDAIGSEEETILKLMKFISDNNLLVAKYAKMVNRISKTSERIRLSDLVQGVGVVDTIVNDSNRAAYETWRHMLRRAYSRELKNRKHSYSECIVSEEWLTFSKFLEYYKREFKENSQLDKDILVPGNKVYSETTCCFVPTAINGILVNIEADKNGTHYDTKKEKYRASISIKGKTKNLGNYNTEEEATKAYRAAKKEYVISTANEYLRNGIISENVAKALISRVSNW